MTEATSQVVADTQVLVWYLTASVRLSSSAKEALEASVAHDHPIVVNSISLVEIVYAAEKAKNPLTGNQRDYVFEVLDEEDGPFLVVPTTPAIGRAMARIPRDLLPDPANRAIAATGIAMALSLVTADGRLREAADRGVLNVIW